ncbi:MAG TPA: Rieske (2Fe-2S) protein [Jatrophihabitans sp.]|nr:Rieske (2Fe-2S) protein [Jatrophihabitans sp.]
MAMTDGPTDGTGGVSRRGVLAAGAVGVAGVALAGCAKAAPPDNPTVTGSAGAGSGGGTLANLSSIPVGGAVSATAPDGAKIIISRPTASSVAAFSAICTHQGCVVVPAGQQLDCPCHGSVYNATTGAVINGPAPRPLPAVSVKISGGDVVAG